MMTLISEAKIFTLLCVHSHNLLNTLFSNIVDFSVATNRYGTACWSPLCTSNR